MLALLTIPQHEIINGGAEQAGRIRLRHAQIVGVTKALFGGCITTGSLGNDWFIAHVVRVLHAQWAENIFLDELLVADPLTFSMIIPSM